MDKIDLLNYIGNSKVYYEELEKYALELLPTMLVTIGGKKINLASFRFYFNKKCLAYCNVKEGCFDLMIRYPEKEVDIINKQISNMSEYANQRWSVRYPCGSGAWIHYLVTNEERKKEAMYFLKIKIDSMKK